MKIDYNTLTEDQLEEWVEFVEWSMVPFHLITPRVIRNFSPVFKELRARIWFEEFVNKCERKDINYFYILKDRDENTIFEINPIREEIWCSSLIFEFVRSFLRNSSPPEDQGNIQIFIPVRLRAFEDYLLEFIKKLIKQKLNISYSINTYSFPPELEKIYFEKALNTVTGELDTKLTGKEEATTKEKISSTFSQKIKNFFLHVILFFK